MNLGILLLLLLCCNQNQSDNDNNGCDCGCECERPNCVINTCEKEPIFDSRSNNCAEQRIPFVPFAGSGTCGCDNN